MGKTQPFGYTGYQTDPIAGTYYAQAREYLPEVGRFAGRDVVKGSIQMPYTLNEYGYCWNNPLVLVDRDGAMAVWAGIKSAFDDAVDFAKQWVNNNVGITNIMRQNENLGMLGGYTSFITSENDYRLINVTLENGIFQSVSLNFKANIAGIEGNSSIGIGQNGIEVDSTITWQCNNKYHSMQYNYDMTGIGAEWGSGSANEMNGNGFRINLNPLDTIDFYHYQDTIINNIKNRNENGWYINAGLAELVAVTTVCCLPEIATGVTAVLESLPALLAGIVGVIVISKIPMGNDMHNVDSCEEGI